MAPTTQRTAPPAPQNHTTNGTPALSSTDAGSGDVSVNKKKQKRRQKQAARLAAEQTSQTRPGSLATNAPNGTTHQKSGSQAQTTVNGIGHSHHDHIEQYEPQGGDDLYYSDEDGRYVDNTTPSDPNLKSKKRKSTKSRPSYQSDYQYSQHGVPPAASAFHHPPPPPPPPPMSTGTTPAVHKGSKDRIWNTSTQEERVRIKEFWLSLEEKERRSLVKVEKEAVLKKMKEQQKHSCSCTVCGRKRTAIEEELEVLYDAYYEELEQYANHQQISLDDGTPIIQPPRMYNHSMARMNPSRPPPLSGSQPPRKGRMHELIEDEEDLEDEDYSEDEEDDEEYSDEEYEEEPRGPAADFFNFGNSLTVQGGILTVADDLLKNDGKKFIEMMEQLAERRMQREEEAQYAAAGLRHPSMQAHGHGPPLEEDEYDDEEDDDYDSAEDEEYDEDEMEAMTEEQRMEEGRRMFQIFAARMFEQRVLTAYREKVARERQERLLEELADESRLDAQREAKKAKEAAKKKDKKKQQKQAKEEEKAKRDAEKAAEEAALKALEEQKLKEQQQKKEEQRKKREAEKKAQEEERLRKEAEKQKKLQEVREQQAEAERKQREQKEREKKKREEAKKREREDREAKEREAKERKEREAAERREKEAKAKVDKPAKDHDKKENQPKKQTPQVVPIPIPPLARNKTATAVPLPPGLQPSATPSSHASPHLQIATPAILKAPTPVRARQPSVQGSHQSSPKSGHVQTGSSATSPTSSVPQPAALAMAGKTPSNLPPITQSHPTPSLPLIAPPPGMHPHPYPGMPNSAPIGGPGYPMNFAPMIPGMMPRVPPGHESPLFPHQQGFNGSQFRGFPPANGIPFPPGINGIRPPQGRGGPMDIMTSQAAVGSSVIGSPAMGSPYGVLHGTMPSHSRTHSRHESASYEKGSFETPTLSQTQPIARPVPIGRPSSVPHQESAKPTGADIDDLSNHLGSKALLDDINDPINSNVDDKRGMPTGGLGSGRLGFGGSPMFSDPRGVQSGNSWGAPPQQFGNPAMTNPGNWSNAPGSGWSSNNAFGIIGGPNRHASRPVTVRLLACQACRHLTSTSTNKNSKGFHSIHDILRQVNQLQPPNEGHVLLDELLQICESEGNARNGGGSFVIQQEPHGLWVKYEPENNGSMGRGGAGAPGDIGSPMMGTSNMYGGQRGFAPPGPGGVTSPSGF